MNAPKEQPTLEVKQFTSAPVIPQSYTEYRDLCIEESKKVTSVSYPNREELQAAIDVGQPLKVILKTITKIEADARQPLNDELKLLRANRDRFLDPVTAETSRIESLISGYDIQRINAERAEARRLADEQRKVADQAAAAQREIDRQKTLADAATNKLQVDAAKASLLAAQLAAEKANLQQRQVQSQLSAPVNTPAGTSTRVRYDFEIIDSTRLILTRRELWSWKAGLEQFHFDRAGLLKKLNADTPNDYSGWLPKEDEQSIVMPDYGIRVFVSIKAHLR